MTLNTPRGAGPTAVITDLGVLGPDPESPELVLTEIHPGVEVDRVRTATQWELQVSDDVHRTEPPSEQELSTLRDLVSR